MSSQIFPAPPNRVSSPPATRPCQVGAPTPGARLTAEESLSTHPFPRARLPRYVEGEQPPRIHGVPAPCSKGGSDDLPCEAGKLEHTQPAIVSPPPPISPLPPPIIVTSPHLHLHLPET